MPIRVAVLTLNNTRVKHISLCEDMESAINMHGPDVVEVTETTGAAEPGSHWDGSVFTRGNPEDLIAPKEESIVEAPVND